MKTFKIILVIVSFLISFIGFSQHSKDILIFTKTEGYRHQSIEKGVALIQKLGRENNFNAHHTEDASLFRKEILINYDLVIFLSTTGDILNEVQQKAFEKYIQSGGSFMGIHAATDTEYDWQWYGKLVGAYFESHPNDPNIREATIIVENSKHQTVRHLPSRWKRADEWYNYKNIYPDINVVLSLDESSYKGGTNGQHHPIAWYHEFDRGKSFYTGGGHTEASYKEPAFIKHILEGIRYCIY